MYKCWQPRASHWGLALAGTRRGWGQFGTRGRRVWPPERASVTVRGLTAAPGWKAAGAAFFLEPGKVEAARAAKAMPRAGIVSSQSRARGRRGSVGVLLCLYRPRGKGWMLDESPRQAWGRRGLQFVSQWALWKNAVFPPSREQH